MANEFLKTLPFSLDTYLVRAVHSISGSVLIDTSLSVYRTHSHNIFTKHPHLEGVISHDRDNKNFDEKRSREIIIDHFVNNPDYFLEKVHFDEFLLQAAIKINDIEPALSAADGKSSYVHSSLMHISNVSSVKNYNTLKKRQIRTLPRKGPKELISYIFKEMRFMLTTRPRNH